MTGFAMHATCPACDGTLTIVTASVPRPQETRTVTECVDCNRRWLIHVACALIDHARPKNFPRQVAPHRPQPMTCPT